MATAMMTCYYFSRSALRKLVHSVRPKWLTDYKNRNCQRTRRLTQNLKKKCRTTFWCVFIAGRAVNVCQQVCSEGKCGNLLGNRKIINCKHHGRLIKYRYRDFKYVYKYVYRLFLEFVYIRLNLAKLKIQLFQTKWNLLSSMFP